MPDPVALQGVDLGERGLGERLRAARTRRGMTLREVARRLGISPSLVSQIETGKVQPSVKTLYALTTELAVSLDAMFSLDESSATGTEPVSQGAGTVAVLAPPEAATAVRPAVRVQRASDARTLELESGVRWERLDVYEDLAIEIRRTTYQPGSMSSTDGTLLRHSGREFGTVIEGVLSITVGFEEFALGPGDSISFDSTIPHRLRNEGTTAAYAIWLEIGRYGAVVE
jgi:transcriptional regulator with XRE-family HTH domain